MRRTDPLIVGAGPAGSAAAIALARGGARPLLLDRQREAGDAVCGAFLGGDALAALAALGIDVTALGGQPITRVRVIAGDACVEAALPWPAAGLSRRTLDAALTKRAVAAGAGLERGVAVRRLDPAGAHLADGALLDTETIFLATGKHPLRGAPREGATGRHVGLRTTLPGARDLAGIIELHLFVGGYAGLLLQEDGRSNLCLSVEEDRLRRAGSPAMLIASLLGDAPRLADRIGSAECRWSAIAAVPYGWRADITGPGRFRLGDQAAVISSLAGDGMAIAIASGRAAAAAWLRGGAASAEAYQRRFAARARRPLATADLLRTIAGRPIAARLLVGGAARIPGLLGLAARLTRIEAPGRSP